MTWRTAYLPLLVILILAVSLLWNLSNVPVMSKKCRESETARHVYMRKLHLNDSDVNNVIILNETINWPQIHIQPKRFHLNRNLTFLVVVHSDVYNFDRRHELRHIFTKKLRKMANFDMLFVTGRPMESEIQKVIKEEAGEFDDVLQSFHIDNYQSMPMKAHAWISYLYDKFQNSTKFVLKIDDDVSINSGLVNNFLVSRPSAESEKSVFCYPFKVAADKRENSKFYLSENEFPFRNLGIFCAGLAYILSADVVPHLYRNIQRTRFVWLDDWYVTHALLVNVDFTIYDTSAFYLMSETNREACNRLRRILDGSLPTPWFAHLRPRKLFDSFRQLEFWTRSQLCVDGFKDPRFV
ncbi:hypothetical protein L596_027827 [Steinernema carpocapsae]|uniref:Hexosyltransferase n=1 Tax=Steinernema carpocapsae TaxID=34508 RepID=A0A4U5LWP8_STECR|nr:hypothetical protein L596_027827 [Steinernema carpocapsae]